MDVNCSKCGSRVILSTSELSSPDRLESILCKACGAFFDARTMVPEEYRRAPEPAKKKGSGEKLEAVDPKVAVAELKAESAGGAPAKTPPERRKLPNKIGVYEIISEINRGGMGIVYKAIDPALRRTVAIKVLLAGEGATDEDVKRFQREAQAIARLHHPHIVPIYAVGKHEGKPYFVMDYVEGRTAKQLKDENLMTPRLALSIIEKVADALHHAHQHGVIHRDVKPANIIVDKSERVLLMDFGLARRVDEDLDVTQAGTTMGTPSYMSPEQAEGKLNLIDARSDVYSAGACLYELLTGQPPFDGTTVMVVLRRILEEQPRPPRHLNPRIHADVETICLKCLEKEKAGRYETAKQLAEDIRRFNTGEAIIAKPLSLTEVFFRKAKRHRETTVAVTVVLIIGLLAMSYGAAERRKAALSSERVARARFEQILNSAQDSIQDCRLAVDKISNGRASDLKENVDNARRQLTTVLGAFRQAESMKPDHETVRDALKTLRAMENELEVRRLIVKARQFLTPVQDRPEDPLTLPNFALAEFAAQEALDRDPGNTEALQLLHIASGIRLVSIDATQPADVYARRILDGQGRMILSEGNEVGQSLGPVPVQNKQLEPGLYVITFVRAGKPVQQATLMVSRESRQDDLHLVFTINADERNTVMITAGTVNMPQVGEVNVPAFLIDRYEYPNVAGVAPQRKAFLLEARKLCREQGKELCTGAQWQRACTGDERRRYPYGKAYVSQLCATSLDVETQKSPMLSGQYSRCRTPDGIYDMSGNLAEWTDGENQEPLAGGDWTSPAKYSDLTSSCRARSLSDGVPIDRVGFRCCKELK